MHNAKAGRRRERGQSVVEFCLMMPIVILLLAGAIDLGNGFQTWINLTNAAREGARKASTTSTYTVICDYTADELDDTGISLSCVSGSPDVVVSYPGAGGADSGCAANVREAGCPVRVTVTFNMPTLVGQVLAFNTLRISAYVDMVVFST